MMSVALAVPGDIGTSTGGYGYDRRLLALVPRQGVPFRLLSLPGSYPRPSDDDVARSVALANAQTDGTILLIDGLALGAMPRDAIAAIRHPIAALCHHPLGLEAGLPAEEASRLVAMEREALALSLTVIVTSRSTARLLVRDFDVPEAKIHVAEPGTDPAERAVRGGDPTRLLAIGSIIPRKGYDVLLQALAALKDLSWTLTIVGGRRDETHADHLDGLVRSSGLADRVTFRGELDDAGVAAAYAAADIFVMPSLFEGFGMVLTEALARGLPIVATRGGAAAETIPDEAALKVEPGDVAGLAEALRGLLADRSRQDQLSDAAWHHASGLSRWDDTARRVADALRDVMRWDRP